MVYVDGSSKPLLIRQFAQPLPTSMVGFHRLGYFRPLVPETSGLWVSEAVMGSKYTMGLELQHGGRNTSRSVMGFGMHHGVRNTPWGEKCVKGRA